MFYKQLIEKHGEIKETNEHLIQLYQNKGCDKSLSKLIVKNIPMIIKTCHTIKNMYGFNYQKSLITEREMLHYGIECIIKCASLYNLNKNNKFSTYLHVSLFNFLRKYFKDEQSIYCSKCSYDEHFKEDLICENNLSEEVDKNIIIYDNIFNDCNLSKNEIEYLKSRFGLDGYAVLQESRCCEIYGIDYYHYQKLLKKIRRYFKCDTQ